MQKKKILYIHHSGRLGGAPKSLSLLVQRIDREKYEPIILTIKNGPAVELLKSTGAQVIVKPYLFPYHGTTVSGMSLHFFLQNNVFLIPTFLGARRIIKRINPDLIHLNTTCLFAFAAAAKSLKPKVNVITHVREPLLDNIFGKILKYANYRFVDGFISICKNDESHLLIKQKPAEVVYNFVDFKTYNRALKSKILRDELKLANTSIVCLCLARIASTNGTLELIQRFNELDDRFQDYKLIIVGKKLNNKYEKKCIKEASNNPNIFILPFRKDVPEVIASSDIVFCPFTEPHFARGIIEASAMGKPTIGNRIGGVDELIIHEETGYLINISSQTDFENRMLQLKSEEKRTKLGEKGYAFAKDNFDAKTNAEKTFGFYDRFI
ncbi:glycosyltransferase family 4 protein [Maribellus mangrovi]|uniref:glycosyltransferase family 4 protein n=1 Tax=Maribellus mangrovi TaxID=3133146 RepID=UPI0030EF2938